MNHLGDEDAHLIRATSTISTVSHCIRELLENSLDAGSKIINIQIKNAGLESIIVSDDGRGISHDNFAMICREGATSKISDINNFSGGRGRALDAISGISYLTIDSSDNNSGSGFRLKISRNQREISPIPKNRGTSVTVQSLFYAYPVRRHYCFQHRLNEQFNIDEVIAAFAMSTKANISFSIDGKLAAHVHSQNVISRVQSVLGKDVANSLAHGVIDLKHWQVGASAEYYSTPLDGNFNGRIYESINGRPFVNINIIRGIRNEYKSCNGNRWPVVVLLLSIPSKDSYSFTPDAPFVNVDFVNEEKLKSLICEELCLFWKNSLSKNSSEVSLSRIKSIYPVCLRGCVTKSSNTTDKILERRNKLKNNEYKINYGYRNCVITESSLMDMEIIGQWNRSFILTRLGPDIFAIDQGLASKLIQLGTLASNNNIEQKTITPIKIELNQNDIQSARENIQQIRNFGYTFDICNDEIFLTAIPTDKSVSTAINTFLEIIAINKAIKRHKASSSSLNNFSKTSFKSGEYLSRQMMKNIIEKLATNDFFSSNLYIHPIWHCITTLDGHQ